MSYFNKYFIIFVAFLSFSAANASTYTIINNATIGVGVDFYYYVNIMTQSVVYAGQTKQITTSDSSNTIKVRAHPAGIWSGTLIQFPTSNVQAYTITITSTSISPTQIQLTVYSGGVQIGTSIFTKRLPI